jgi:predicted GNAT family acetyltransferase
VANILRKFFLWLTKRWIAPDNGFTSRRLRFRPLRSEDVPGLCPRITLACVAEMCIHNNDVRDQRVFRGSFAHAYAIEIDNHIVGFMALNRADNSFGIWIAPEHRVRGYASETVVAFLTHPRLGKSILAAGCFEDNTACRRLIEGSGFREERRTVIKSRFCPEARVGVFYFRARNWSPPAERRMPETN